MRTSMAYFAGAGTVVAAVVVGLGGGLVIANIVSPHTTEMSKLERRMSAAPIPAPTAPSDPAPYLAATQAAATKPVVVAPAPQGSQTEAASAAPAETSAPRDTAAAQPAAASPPPAPPSAPREQAAASEDRARDTDVKREADVKRSVAEKRRADRRQQWAERRHQRQDSELREVEQKVREETDPPQAFAVESARVEMPRIKFFDSE